MRRPVEFTQHPTQFCYTLLLAEDERGFIADHQLQQGNPPDAPQLVPAIQRVIAVTGRTPTTVVGDRGGAVAFAASAVEQRDWPHDNAPSSPCAGSTV